MIEKHDVNNENFESTSFQASSLAKDFRSTPLPIENPWLVNMVRKGF